MSIRLYHPNLQPPNNECEVMNDAQVAVMAESGWELAPESEADSPAHVAEPVTYAPVEPSKKTAVTKKAASKDTAD